MTYLQKSFITVSSLGSYLQLNALHCNLATKDLWQMKRMANVYYFNSILPGNVKKRASHASCISNYEKQLGYVTWGSTGKNKLQNMPDIKSLIWKDWKDAGFCEGRTAESSNNCIMFPGKKSFLLLAIVFNQKLFITMPCAFKYPDST